MCFTLYMGLYSIGVMRGEGNIPSCYMMGGYRGDVYYFSGEMAIFGILLRILPAVMLYPTFSPSYPVIGPRTTSTI